MKLSDTERARLARERNEKIARVLERYTEQGDDSYYMEAALELARLAYEEGEVPIGAIVVRDGRIISADYNGRETFKDATHHAETAAIQRACHVLGGWRLIGCTLYTTVEPCPMCAGAVWNARLPRVVIGAPDLRAGAMGTLSDLFELPLNHKPEVLRGVKEEESRRLLQIFFRERR